MYRLYKYIDYYIILVFLANMIKILIVNINVITFTCTRILNYQNEQKLLILCSVILIQIFTINTQIYKY